MSDGGKQRICVVGGGATGLSLLWCLASPEVRDQVEVTLIHNQSQLGGHSYTYTVEYPPGSGTTYDIDIGVQFVCPLLYPNLQKMVQLPEFKDSVFLDDYPELKLASAFTEELNWGNFPAYQSGPRFDQCYTPEAVDECSKFVSALEWEMVFDHSMTLDELFKKHSFSDHFINYFLLPYLSIINGYGGNDLLTATVEDLFPLFVKLPIVEDVGPLAAFPSPGLGWQRFRDGSRTWIEAMAAYAAPINATLIYGAETRVEKIHQQQGGAPTVIWCDDDGAIHQQEFDCVVLTTDMQANYSLLRSDDGYENPYWTRQEPLINDIQQELKPGSCYIHTDENVLGPSLRDQVETLQFTASYAWSGSGDPPYDLPTTYSTYILKNIIPDMPDDAKCYLTMYGESEPQHPPAEGSLLVPKKTWTHGSFLGSSFYTPKTNLHKIQGLGGVWYAGNNTTLDDEEGALLSAMIIAEKLTSYNYPFTVFSEAFAMYEVMKNLMFPNTLSRFWHDRRPTRDGE